MAVPPLDNLRALYCDFLERGVRHFFPDALLERTGTAETTAPTLTVMPVTGGELELLWFGIRYFFRGGPRPFTEDQFRLLMAIGSVLSARYRSIFHPVTAATTLYSGVAVDRYVSAFLDHTPYPDDRTPDTDTDVIAAALEVLRESSLVTYENRRISTGVLLLGPNTQVPEPAEALPYNSSLVSGKSFHRMCDGVNTLYIVNRRGLLLDLAELREWAKPNQGQMLPAPSPARYTQHSQATLRHGHICLVLTRNGEIKVFSEGLQVFSFLEGRWRLTDAAEKYHLWQEHVGNGALAERTFSVALNLAERRRGGLLVVLDDPRSARELLTPGDMLANTAGTGLKSQLHYLLRNKRALELPPPVVESIARVDAAIVMDRESNLLAFGAILRTGAAAPANECVPEGGRTTAAIGASRFGSVLKISEDGPISFYRSGEPVWEI